MTRRIELSPRLRLAADLVPEGARLADVGTDHAYLPACLLMEGKIPSAIAADLREGPLSRARETAAGVRLWRPHGLPPVRRLSGIRRRRRTRW